MSSYGKQHAKPSEAAEAYGASTFRRIRGVDSDDMAIDRMSRAADPTTWKRR